VNQDIEKTNWYPTNNDDFTVLDRGAK